MARIPAQELERLKKEISLVHLVESHGIKLERKGKDLVGLCPFHDDKTPSLVITPEKNLWHCLGACQEGGSVIDWVMKMEGVSFTHAVDRLKSNWSLSGSGGSRGAAAAPGVHQLFDTEDDNRHLLNQTLEFYHKTLKESPAALKYLSKRKLNHPEVVDYFKLGFANRTLGYRIPKGRAGAALKRRLKDIGILRDSGHEHFNGSLVIPIMDEGHCAMGAYGRKVRTDLRNGTAFHLYLRGAHKGVFNISCLAASKEVILCEALIDALTFWCHGFRNVISSYGINGFTAHHLAAFKRHGTRKVWIAYDHDDSGNLAADKLALELGKEGIQCLRVRFPHLMDANSYACCEAQPEKALRALIENAELFPNQSIGYDGNLTPPEANLTPSNPNQTPLKHPQNTPKTPLKHPIEITSKAFTDESKQGVAEKKAEKSHIGGIDIKEPSYRTAPPSNPAEKKEEKALRALIENAELFPNQSIGYDGNLTPPEANLTPSNPNQTPLKHPQNTPKTPLKHPIEITSKAFTDESKQGVAEKKAEKSHIGGIDIKEPSYRTAPPSNPAEKKEEKAAEAAKEEKKGSDEPSSRLSHTTSLNKDEIVIPLGDRRWRIRGLGKCMSYEQLKVNILVSQGDRFFVDSLDLYSSRLRVVFIKHAAAELEVNQDIIKNDLGRVLLKIEDLQDDQIKKALEPKKTVVHMTSEERAEALDFLRQPRLLERILEDFNKCGVVGEESNKLVGYLATVSRKLENPLAVIIQSSSAAGKTLLMDAILSFMPPEERIKYSAMTGQSLYYLGETDLKHKILAIVEEEGAEKASYALKLLQSEKELSIASTGKDQTSGKLVTREYRVEGPVMIFITTTGIDIDEELQNRCLILTVNESRQQTQAIHQLQRYRRTLSGLSLKKERDRILALHRNAQRLLKPFAVVNPYAPMLTFLDDRTRTRRDHEKYLNLIDTIALLHQYQRKIKKLPLSGRKEETAAAYLEISIEDIEMANKLAGDVLGRSLDELPPQTRQLLFTIEEFVNLHCKKEEIRPSDFRFSRRQIREYNNWSNTRLTKHLKRLEELEYLVIHRGRRGQSFVYELLYDGQGKDNKPFLMGLIDVKRLLKSSKSSRDYDGNLTPPESNLTPRNHSGYDGNLTPPEANLTPSNPNQTPLKHPQNTPKSPLKHPIEITSKAFTDESKQGVDEKKAEKSHIGGPTKKNHNRSLPTVIQLALHDAYLAAKINEFEQQGGPYPAAEPRETISSLAAAAPKSRGNGRGK